MTPPPADLYFSVDAETDGPIPGRYSMLSFGLAIAGRYDGRRFEVHNPAERTFYAELAPISDEWVPEAVRVSGLDRERLRRNGRPPQTVMDEAGAWVRAQANRDRPVLVGYPLVFDWMFVYWYFVFFAAAGSPFGFSGGLDIKTMYQQKAGVVLSDAVKRKMPRDLRGDAPHTHHALDDAIEQAHLFARVFAWDGH